MPIIDKTDSDRVDPTEREWVWRTKGTDEILNTTIPFVRGY